MTKSLGFRKISTLIAEKKAQSWALKVSRAVAVVSWCAGMGTTTARAQSVSNNCASLPDNTLLKSALTQAVNDEASGLNLNMWATIVACDGTVCAVAFSGTNSG